MLYDTSYFLKLICRTILQSNLNSGQRFYRFLGSLAATSPRVGTLIFHKYVGLPGLCHFFFFCFQNFEFQYFGVLRRMNIFWGMKILWIFFGSHHKIGLYLKVIYRHFMVFSVKVQNGGISFWIAKISNILGVLEIPDAGPEPTYEEKK